MAETTEDLARDVLAAIDQALDELPQPPTRFERDRWRSVSRIAVAAAVPLIAAAERERNARMADELGATVPQSRVDGVVLSTVPFTDLIREDSP